MSACSSDVVAADRTEPGAIAVTEPPHAQDAPAQDATDSVPYRLRMDSMPKAEKSISRHLDEYRRKLEAAVTTKYGEVSVYHADVIQAAMRFESIGKRWAVKRRRNAPDWSVETQLKVDGIIAARTKDRISAIERLGISDVAEINLLDLYSNSA